MFCSGHMIQNIPMKQLIGILTCVFLLAGGACTKKEIKTGGPSALNPDSTSGALVNCSATPSDILHLTIFPADITWNQDISTLPVDSSSIQILSAFAGAALKADFGSGTWNNVPIGIPFVVVCGDQPKLPVVFRANGYDGNYGDESDPGPYPIPPNAPVEGNGQ